MNSALQCLLHCLQFMAQMHPKRLRMTQQHQFEHYSAVDALVELIHLARQRGSDEQYTPPVVATPRRVLFVSDRLLLLVLYLFYVVTATLLRVVSGISAARCAGGSKMLS